jgi:hypothetical protein
MEIEQKRLDEWAALALGFNGAILAASRSLASGHTDHALRFLEAARQENWRMLREMIAAGAFDIIESRSQSLRDEDAMEAERAAVESLDLAALVRMQGERPGP